MGPIALSVKSISRVVKLCSKVKRNNPNNERTAAMAQGMAVFVQHYGYVSQKQAVWLCRNFDHWNVKRPSELTNVAVASIRKYIK